jgi:TPR repeat protein
MGVYKRTKLGMARLRRRARRGDLLAASNLAAEYRILRRPALAFRWWTRAVEIQENGDDLLELAYCLQHGIGVRRDPTRAARSYARASRSSYSTEGAREEALYHLATLLLEQPRARKKAANLLRRANTDDDYPQARALLAQLSSRESELKVCHCRRWLMRSIGGTAKCRIHAPNGDAAQPRVAADGAAPRR